MSLIDQILSDLQQVTNESKKNAQLKQVVQQAIESVKQFKIQTPASLTQSQYLLAFPVELIMKTLVQASQVKINPKMPGLALATISLVQKLHNINLVKNEDQIELLQCLYLMRDTSDEQIQLRLTQCTLQMVTPVLIDFKHPEHYEKMLSILFLLSASKNPIVQNTIISGAQEVIKLLFRQYAQEANVELRPSQKNAQTLFMDLIKGMQGQKVMWVSGFNSKGLCRDLLFDVIKQLGSLLNSDEVLSRYVLDYISPILYEEMALDDSDIKFNARRVRAVFRIMIYLRRDIALVKHLGQLFQRGPQLHYLKYWILEGIMELLSDPQLVMILHQNPENLEQKSAQPSTHQSYLQHLINLIKLAAEQDESQSKTQNYKGVRFMDSNTSDYNEAPIYSQSQFHRLAIECTLCLSEQLLSLAKDNNLHLGNKNYLCINNKGTSKNVLEETIQVIPLLTQLSQEKSRYQSSPNAVDIYNIADGIQGVILKLLKHLMKVQHDERLVQIILNITQIWINVTGSVGQLRARDSFLKFLTSLCVTENPNEALAEKNLQSSKTLFNVAHCLGGIMDVNSWFVVLQAMHIFEGQLARTQQIAQQSEQQHEVVMWSQELSILSNVLEGLFTQSHLYDDQQLLQVLDALNQVTLGVMEQQSSGGQLDTRALKFCLSKITQMASVNWYRVNVFWDFVAAHFSCVANCKQTLFRQTAVESLGLLLELGFSYFQKAYSAKHQEDDEISPVLKSKAKKWNRTLWQESLLQPIFEVVQVKFGETRQQVLQGLLKLLQNNGHEFSQGGFMCIIGILNLSSMDKTIDNSYVQTGFEILQLIVSQFVNVLEPQTTKELLPLIANYRVLTSEPNISFVSVDLIWQLADNLGKLNDIPQDELQELWKRVLLSLKDICLDRTQDVRQQALQILIQITLINCAAFTIDFQVSLLRDVLFTIFDALIGRVAQLQKQQGIFLAQTPKFLSDSQTPRFTKFTEIDLSSHQQNEIQWEETLKLMVQNLSKVVKKLQQVQGFESHSQNIHNEVFVRLFMMFRFQNVDLKHEIAKFVKENTQLIVEKLHDQSMEWSRELLIVLNEFLFQKVNDARDQKTLINKILPEVCETFVLLMRAHHSKLTFYDTFVDDVLDCYQQVIEQPIKMGNLNVKMWFDDKFLHDYISELIEYSGPNQWKFLKLINLNLKKPIGQHVVTDLMIKKFVQVYSDVVCSDDYTLNKHKKGVQHEQHLSLLQDHIQIVEQLIESRRDTRLLTQIKSYSNSSVPLWNSCTPYFQKLLLKHQDKVNITYIPQQIMKPLVLTEQVSQDALKSCSDLELSWCGWVADKTPQIIIEYWMLLQGGYLYSDILFYDIRKKIIQILFCELTIKNTMPILKQVLEDLLLTFNKDEHSSGSMPLPRQRVQEIIFVLQELKKIASSEGHPLLYFMHSLTQLITTKEQEIKLPLQEIFQEIALVINKEFKLF